MTSKRPKLGPTPGPWTVWRSEVWSVDHTQNPDKWTSLAVVRTTNKIEPLQAQRNGEMLAAAPALLDACVALMHELAAVADGEECDHDADVCWCDAVKALRDGDAAVKAARGGE